MKIFINVPYIELKQEFAEIIRGYYTGQVEIQIDHIVGTGLDLEEIRSSDVVIARGITSRLVKEQMPQIHVVELATTGYDVMDALYRCKTRRHARKIAYLSSESSQSDWKVICALADVEISVYPVRNETEIMAAIQEALSWGAEAFIGNRTAYEICSQNGYCFEPLNVGREAMERAVKAALNTVASLYQERQKTSLVKRLLNNAEDALLAFDHNGRITEGNNEAYYLFRIDPARGRTQTIEELLPFVPWKKMLEEGKPYESIETLEDGLCLVKGSVLADDGLETGLLFRIQRAERLREADNRIRKELRQNGLVAKYQFSDILGNSPQIQKSIREAVRYSKVDSNVLLVGETGTGKELFAHGIHNSSGRCTEPFVAINCAALPENLLESELFGYVEGAFSGASKGGKIGLFELAHKGTIFLDEIGELPITLQAKLLRVLQEKEVRRLGGSKVISIDVRVISATNVNIQEKIERGEFRSDLFYRLNILDIHLPALRERKEDIDILMNSFIEHYRKRLHAGKIALEPEAVELLKHYDWPGNVREMRHLCEKLVVLNESGRIGEEEVQALSLDIEKSEGEEGWQDSVNFEELCQDGQAMNELIQNLGIKKSHLAKQMGISRTTLWRRMNREDKKQTKK